MGISRQFTSRRVQVVSKPDQRNDPSGVAMNLVTGLIGCWSVQRVLAAVLLVTMAFVLPSCGRSKPSPFRRVSGEVTYKGAPVADAIISLVPRGADGRSASATTTPSGKFLLGTINAGDGALPGDYDVTVIKMETVESPYISVTDMDEQKMAAEGRRAMPAVPKPKFLLPVKYSKPKTSGLTATVRSEETTELKFELVD